MDRAISMRSVDPNMVADIVYDSITEISCSLRDDYRRCAETILQEKLDGGCIKDINEPGSRSCDVLRTILENDDVARSDHVPICQDTGTVWVCLEIGPDVKISGGVFSKVDDAVARAYKDNALRMSVVFDAIFDRRNTGDNTPAFCEIKLRKEEGATLHVLLKGGGSDNASKVVMLSPGSGRDGVIDTVISCVREKAANACPPLVVGIGIGSTFDKVAGLAKHALLRPIGSISKMDEKAAFELELLDRINSLGIGPAALGGYPTALAVHIESAPCHIAALPLAVNMGCCAMRSKSVDLF